MALLDNGRSRQSHSWAREERIGARLAEREPFGPATGIPSRTSCSPPTPSVPGRGCDDYVGGPCR